jgi:hypothetical protein
MKIQAHSNTNFKIVKRMKYRFIQRENPQDRSKVKWYASPVNDGKIAKNDLVETQNFASLQHNDNTIQYNDNTIQYIII